MKDAGTEGHRVTHDCHRSVEYSDCAVDASDKHPSHDDVARTNN